MSVAMLESATQVRAGPRTYQVSLAACVRGAPPYQHEWQHLVRRDDGTTIKVKAATARPLLSSCPDPEEWLRATRAVKKQCNAQRKRVGADHDAELDKWSGKPTSREVLKEENAESSADSETEKEDGKTDDGESECASEKESLASAASLELLDAKRKQQEQAAALDAAEQRIAQLTAQLAAQSIAGPPPIQPTQGARPKASAKGTRPAAGALHDLSPVNANRLAQNIPRATPRYGLRSNVTVPRTLE